MKDDLYVIYKRTNLRYKSCLKLRTRAQYFLEEVVINKGEGKKDKVLGRRKKLCKSGTRNLLESERGKREDQMVGNEDRGGRNVKRNIKKMKNIYSTFQGDLCG
jgi:hypothetical protein